MTRVRLTPIPIDPGPGCPPPFVPPWLDPHPRPKPPCEVKK